ncbi:MAG: 30S ribosomal protein S6 [Patescibacteria group bacterium]
MRKYEFVLVLRPSLKKQQEEELLTGLEKEFKSKGVKVDKKEDLSNLNFCYPIAEEDKGHFLSWQLSASEGFNFTPVATFINRQSDIIRYLLLKIN